MSPTSGTLKAVSSRLTNNSFSSESPEAAGTKLISVNENRENPLLTVVLITIAYLESREEENRQDENGKEKTDPKPKVLKAPQNDLELLLFRHGYTNNGPGTFFICADFDHGYTESKNTHVKTASKSDIIDALVKAASLGGHIVIYYSGHCGLERRGKSKDGVEDVKRPYLVSSDCRRIYGEEVYAALSMELVLNGERKMNIILSFDTCHVATFFDHVFVLPYVYRAKALGGLEIEPHGGAKLGQNQIIFLASTRFDQEARTWVPGKEYGAVTFFTYWQFRVLDLNVPRTAKELVERLYSRCHDGGQDPQIRALRPIDDSDLKLLLG